MTIEQIIICIQTGIIFYLYFLYKTSIEKKKEDDSMYYFNSKRPQEGQSKKGGPDTSLMKKETEEENIEDDENYYPPTEKDKEYNYVDPNFKLEPVIPYHTTKGTIIDEHGDAFYGNNKKYYSSIYYGRVSKGAEVELKDRRVYKNEFEIHIVKVLVLTNEWDSEVGRIGWVGLKTTSFRDRYDPETGLID